MPSACDHGDKGNLCAAGDEGGGHDGHTAVAFVFNGTRSHNAGNTAAGADEHRDKGFTRKSEFAEYTVKHEGYTRHITASLQESKEQEQYKHLGNKA